MSSTDAQKKVFCWKESGFADFADGTFGNGGQNIYVSKSGILQRIHRFDLNQDGYVDLVFANSQDFNERPPVFVYSDVFDSASRIELTTLGAYAAAVADLNGDGYDDLVLANQNNGTHPDVTAFVYYGSSEGLTERYKIELPAPNSRAVAIGDFNGDGRLDLAFASDSKLRIFYQTENCYMPAQFADFDLDLTHMASADLDGDGYADLYVRLKDGRPRILWGGPNGIDLENHTLVGGEDTKVEDLESSTADWLMFAEGWAAKILSLNGVPHVYRLENGKTLFYPVNADRSLGDPLVLNIDNSVSAAAGDINGNGYEDIVVTVCKDISQQETSWIYSGGENGFSEDHKSAISTTSARDAVIEDLTGDGFRDLIICQGRTDIIHDTESLVFKADASGISPEPVRIPTHDALTVLVARTNDEPNPQVIFVNHVTGRVCADVPIYIYYGSKDGYSPENRAELLGWAPHDVNCIDFTDNGWADLLLCNCSENAPHLDPGSFIYLGGPDGFNEDRKVVLPTYRAMGQAVGDFRHCGYLDIASIGYNNPELLIFRGGPDGYDTENPQQILLDPDLKSFTNSKLCKWSQEHGPEYSETGYLITADFNNDGWLDLYVPQCRGNRSIIFWGSEDGFSMENSTWLATEGGLGAQAADLTGNGYLDLIIGSYRNDSKQFPTDTYIYIYWGGPDGYREDRRAQFPAHTVVMSAVADFNNDGYLDIYASSYNGGRDRDLDAYIYWGGPGGNYSVENRSRLFCHSASGVVAADFNEDGWIDLAVAHHKTYGNHVGESKVWWNGPDGFCEKRVTKLPTLGPHAMPNIDPGNIMDRSPEEHYISSPFQLPEGAEVKSIKWDAEIQTKTWVKAQIRFAPTKEALDTARWQGTSSEKDWFECGDTVQESNRTGSWIQYRLALGAVNGGNTPRIKSVEVEYSA